MNLFRGVRRAVRGWRRDPWLALTSIAVLALGIGANTAIFSVVYAVILRPLPYPDPSRLVFVWQRFPGSPAPINERMYVARRNYREWQRQNTVFQEMAAFLIKPLEETGSDSSGKTVTCFASAGLFHLLGVQPRLGRLFRAGEERGAVLSDAYFDRRFHRDPNALGKTVILDGATYTVIGVLPAGFSMPRTFFNDSEPDLIVPLPEDTGKPGDIRQVTVAARLRPGVSLRRARAEMAGLAARIDKTGGAFFELGSTSVFRFSDEAANVSLNRALYLLLGAAGFLLLIACANLANLFLARATSRAREVTVQLALGATRGRVIAHLLSEAMVVATAGAACGVLLAYWSLHLILRFKPPDLERPGLIAIHLPVLGFTTALAVLTVFLFGLGPALAASRADIADRLKTGGGWGASAAKMRSRQLLIAGEVALALMLLMGAGLMIRSLQQIAAVGIGFDTGHLAALDLSLPEKRYPEQADRAGMMRRLIARVEALPGVAGAAVTSALPLHTVGVSNFHIPGRLERSRGDSPIADVAAVSPGLFRLLGLPLKAGRRFRNADLRADGSHKEVAVVNEAFARKYFPGESPLGRRLLSGDEKESFEIVGVVGDYRPMGAENGPRPEIFRPSLAYTDATLVVRSRAAPQLVARSVLDAARSVAPGTASEQVKTLDEYADYWTAQRKFNTLLLGIFAGLALVLSLLGIYGVLSHAVAACTREIGIRMAVGASPGAIGGLVLRQSMVPVAIGLALGLGGCAALGRPVQALLFDVRPLDPLSLCAAAGAILLAAPAAVWLPLRRATAVDCTVALRQE